MPDNLFETQYDVTKKSKIKRIYEENKILIYLIISFFFITIVALSFYSSSKEKKNILLSEKFIIAQNFIKNKDNDKAKIVLKNIIFEDNKTYSVLSLNLIINENLVTDKQELLNLFDKILESKKIKGEERNLIIFKKALLQSTFANEIEILNTANLLLNSQSIWKPHVLMLLGDYFVSKGENLKAKEFYQQILVLNNLHQNMYEQAQSQLINIANE